MTAAGLITLAQIWGAIGLVVAFGFLTIGLRQIDEDAHGAIAFRPLLVPGIILLWPLVVWRWWVLVTGRDKWPLRHAPPRRCHGVVAVILAGVIGLTLITSFSLRQNWNAQIAPVQLEPGEVTE